ncbi:MAG TPA: hypothetical protein VJR02_14090 [Pyrinomonadaceae bacterium]|nr:hypothetical protein [Pyrinomonadaceae bacterium]
MPKPNFAQPLSWDECQDLTETGVEIEIALARVQHLDFAMLKMKLGEEKHWSVEYQSEVESLYRRFLALNIVYPDQKICPTGPIDEFWHAHILDTRAYADDCEYLFGHYFHHFPYFGMRGPEDYQDLQSAFEQSKALFIRHFGIDPCGGETQARGCSPQRCP